MAIKDPTTGSSGSSGIQNPPDAAQLPAFVDLKQARKEEGMWFGPTPPANPKTWAAWHPVTNPGWYAWVPTP